jgi:Protein of unknown function (DUF993)
MNRPVVPVSSLSLKLPAAGGSLQTYRLAASRAFPARLAGALNRVAFSAAHVVSDPFADVDPWLTPAIDWDRTIAFRQHIWDLGLGVAEAMDTAQRGVGLDWPRSLELIERSVRAAKARGNALVFSGAGTDHLAPEDAKGRSMRSCEPASSGIARWCERRQVGTTIQASARPMPDWLLRRHARRARTRFRRRAPDD